MPLSIEKCSRIPQRWIMAIMSFFALFNAYTLRICLSIALTQMIIPRNHYENASRAETCPEYGDYASIINVTTVTKGIFNWSEYTQGVILSSFYFGYTISQLPGGFVAEIIGAKHTIGLAVLFTAILTIATPVATLWGDSKALITIRFFMGLCEGVIHPAMSRLLSSWLPPQERSTITSFVFNGIKLGILLSSIGSGLIIGGSSDNWPHVFYVFGCIGILWYFLWALLVYNTPKEHPFITEREKTYLREKMSGITHEDVPPFPWRHALLSKPLFSLLLIQIAFDWSNYLIVSDLPKYMHDVLKLPVKLNAYASSLYNVSAWAFSIFMSWLSDISIEKQHVSRTIVRKINASIAGMGPAVFLLLTVYAGCDVILAVSLVTLGLTFSGCFYPGIKVNVMDLSPNYCGVLMGIINGIGAIAGILSPYTVGVLTPNQTLEEWRIIFWIVGVVYLIGTINFLLFSSGDVQPWNDPTFLKRRESNRQFSDEGMGLMLREKINLSSGPT
ncbi:sialin-like [Copidosoma floridanum]|uniref:sialin-like n=1 Tax=Copidosoma floridanum TaxID=29053 RepID=UPI0006C9415A|nr:sialin-like [Copidosoma floridanum]